MEANKKHRHLNGEPNTSKFSTKIAKLSSHDRGSNISIKKNTSMKQTAIDELSPPPPFFPNYN